MPRFLTVFEAAQPIYLHPREPTASWAYPISTTRCGLPAGPSPPIHCEDAAESVRFMGAASVSPEARKKIREANACGVFGL